MTWRTDPALCRPICCTASAPTASTCSTCCSTRAPSSASESAASAWPASERVPELPRIRGGGALFPQRRPCVGAVLACHPAEAWEGQMVGVHEQAFIGRQVEEPAPAGDRVRPVMVPWRAPGGMAELQAVVEQVAGTQQPLAVALQQDRGVTWGVASGAYRAQARQDLGVVDERT